MQWTGAQRRAIEARGQNLLVNAGAGAGKTATLVERVYRLITADAAPVSLENMLIVTFTRAAAAEMKVRLAERLRHELQLAWDDPHAPAEKVQRLQAQLTVLPRAPISTLHSFCLRLLREHAEAVALPPDFDLMPEEEAALIHREMIEEAIEETLADDADGPVLFSILEQLPPANGARSVTDLLRRLHGFLNALADPEGFVAGVLTDYEQAGNPLVAFDDKRLGARVRQAVFAPLIRVTDELDAFLAACPATGFQVNWTKKYREFMETTRSALGDLIRNHPANAPLPDLAKLLKPPNRSGQSANMSDADIALHEESARLTPLFAAARKECAALEGGRTLEQVLDEIASTLPFVRLLLGRLGMQLLERLEQHHREVRRLTYAHLERFALRVLLADDGAPSEAALAMREEFEHVLVDEFQDVNELQARILGAVSRPGAEGTAGGNLFVVGDVKQSIYGFRQADPSQFLALYAAYLDHSEDAVRHPGARIDLVENFRSVPALLESLNEFFRVLFSERIGQVTYDASHAFVAGRTDGAGQQPCFSLHLLDGRDAPAPETGDGEDAADDELLDAGEKESLYVARLIRALGVPPGDVAVLLRTAAGHATKLVEAFQREGIDYFTQESIGFLSRQEVSDVLSLLRLIDNPYQDVALAGVLRGPAAEWSEDDLARLRLVDRGARLFDNLRRIAASGSDDHGLEARATSSLCARAKEFLARLREWQAAAQRESMAMLFGRLYDDLSLRERVAVLPNGEQRLANLQFLQDRGVQFDAFRRKGLGKFLSFLDDLLERGDDLGQPSLVAPDANVVRVMTIHKSKGLQFPVVIVPFVGKKFNLKDMTGDAVWDRRHGFAVRYLRGRRYGEKDTSFARRLLLPAMRDRLLSEELRLLYVAMTRARERLVLVASSDKMAEKIASAREKDSHEAADAGTFLDWVMASVARWPEFRALGPDSNVVVSPDGTVEMRLTALGETPGASPSAAADRAPEQMARLQAALPQVRVALERVARLGAQAAAPPIRVKVSATEAKRAHESLHSEDSPPAELSPRRRAARDEARPPAWWPETVAPRERVDSMTRGTLTHRFCAIADLESLARGGSVTSELQRLVDARYFTEAEAGEILADDLQAFFFDSPIGRRVLECRATVQRELPFTVSVPVEEIAPGSPLAGELLIFQGIVDLMFTQRGKAGEQLVVLDFKTDYWDGTVEHWERLEAAYRPQLLLYQFGLERSLKRNVDELWLYFLRAGQPLLVTADRGGEAWKEILKSAYLGHPTGKKTAGES